MIIDHRGTARWLPTRLASGAGHALHLKCSDSGLAGVKLTPVDLVGVCCDRCGMADSKGSREQFLHLCEEMIAAWHSIPAPAAVPVGDGTRAAL